VDGCEVNPVERGILDTLKETEWCRGVTEDGVRWVRMAMLGACPRYRALEYLLLFVTVVDAEPASTWSFFALRPLIGSSAFRFRV